MNRESLLSLLERRLDGGLRFHEFADGALQGRAANSVLGAKNSSTEPYGRYLLARAPGVPELWAALRTARAAGTPLVLLPPSSPAEEEVLLAQLPAQPPAQAALALFTSGTTGEPKAVLHAEASLLASATQLTRAFPGNSPTCSLLPAWGMAGVVFHCLLPAARGSDLLFSRLPFLQWSASAAALFVELDVSLVTLNPFLLEMFLRAGLDARWKGTVVSLTAPLKRPLLAQFALAAGRRPLEIYGMTEAAGPVLLEGKSLGAETRISASHELEIRGPQLFLGYASRGLFEPAPAWFPTGDIFTQEDSTLVHQARDRDLIDTGGRKVAPRLIEEVAELMPEIAECLAFPVVLAGVERPGLIYVRKPDCALPPGPLAAAVESFLSQALSPELRPKCWQEVNAIPRGKNGKPDRKAAGRLMATASKSL